jgi:hypothetical protein
LTDSFGKGQGGMGGGVSFAVGKQQRKLMLAPFYSWQPGTLEVTPQLTSVCQDCAGVCFVVDDAVLAKDESSELAAVRKMFHTLLELNPTVPVLILSFASSNHLLDPRQAARQLGLASSKRVVSVRNVPESTDSGVAEGFEWLTEVM